VISAEELLSRYLDLSPLRNRRCGLVRCIFHRPDRHPSLSIDLDRGIFHCFACRVGGDPAVRGTRNRIDDGAEAKGPAVGHGRDQGGRTGQGPPTALGGTPLLA
jgi:hypothetical protein